MRNLFAVFAVALFLCICVMSRGDEIPKSPAFDERSKAIYESEGLRHSGRQLDRDIRDGRLAERAQKAMDNLIRTAVGELIRRGHWSESEQIHFEWELTYKPMFEKRDISDHPDMVAWVGKVHEKIESMIGLSACRAMHFHDLMILNKTLLVILKPCSVDALEYKKCFAGKVDTEKDYGGVSVISYWITYGAVTGATMGTGYFFIAGIVAEIAEYGFCRLMAQPASDFIWLKSCIPPKS